MLFKWRNLWPRETDMTQRPSFKCTIFVNLHVNIFYLGCGWNWVRHLRCATWVWISGGWNSSWRSSKRNRRVTVEQMSTKYFATSQGGPICDSQSMKFFHLLPWNFSAIEQSIDVAKVFISKRQAMLFLTNAFVFLKLKKKLLGGRKFGLQRRFFESEI